MRASNMVIGCAMEGNEQASVRGFVMVNKSTDCLCPSLSVAFSLSVSSSKPSLKMCYEAK